MSQDDINVLKWFLSPGILLLLFGLAGCATFAPAPRAVPPVELPKQYTLYTEDDPGPGEWWKNFSSVELNRLVEQALAENFDIRTARARLKQAGAQAKKAGAELYPSLDADAGASRRRAYVRDNGNGGAQITDVEEYSLGLAAGYELDLWGRLRAARTSELKTAFAAREDLEAAAMTVTAEVVSTWIDLIAVRRETTLLKEQIKINENLLELQRFRFENGLANALDLSQQMENLASIRSELPLLEAETRVFENALALLVGRTGLDDFPITQKELPAPIPLPETGVPAGLLASRPDVRAAGLRLQSADWSIAAARAERLPALRLTGGASYSSAGLDTLFSNWLTTLAANLTAPLFDGGRRKAEVTRTRAVAEERLAEYGAVVAEAVKEVEDGLVREQNQGRYLKRLNEQLDAAELAMRQARIRYLNGESDYLNYLTGIQNVQQLQRRIVVQRAELLKFRVALYRALGGSWIDQDLQASPVPRTSETS
ncbi:MAG: efflux transporter outer membrane subunit [Desulfovibrionales bacterium]